MDLLDLSDNLKLSDSGIWYASSPRSMRDVSYPKDNHRICFELEDKSFWYTHRSKCIGEVVSRYLPKGPFFDIGGGNGVVSKELQRRGFETCLVEPGISGIENAEKRGLVNLVCATFEDCGFKSEVVSAVGLFDILEHVENDTEFLKSLHDALIKGGKLVMTVPAYSFLWSNHDKEVGHVRRYTIHGVRRQLEEIGYNIEYSTYLFRWLPVPVWLCRALPSRLGLYKNISTETKQKEHRAGFSWLSFLVRYFLKREFRCIQRGGSVSFGSSCFIVASKV